MAGSERRQRQRRVVVRVSAAEFADWHTRAGNARLSVAGYVRSVVSATPAPPPRRQRQPVKDGAALARMLAQLGKIGSNLNQLAHAAHLGTGPLARLVEEACADIRTMRDLLMQALGVRGRSG